MIVNINNIYLYALIEFNWEREKNYIQMGNRLDKNDFMFHDVLICTVL